MKLKNKLLLATIISLGIYTFFVYVAIKIFLYPELLKSEFNSVLEKERKIEKLINRELQNLQNINNIISVNLEENKSTELFANITDFIYIANIKKSKSDLLVSEKFNYPSDANKKEFNLFLEKYLQDKNFSTNESIKASKLSEFSDIVTFKSSIILINGQKVNKESQELLIITGRFLQSSIISEVNFDTNWKIKIFFDKSLIKKLKQKQVSQSKANDTNELIIDNNNLKSFYLMQIGSFKKDVVLELSINDELLYHLKMIIIFTFLATLLSGPLAILFLILIVRIIQSHEI